MIRIREGKKDETIKIVPGNLRATITETRFLEVKSIVESIIEHKSDKLEEWQIEDLMQMHEYHVGERLSAYDMWLIKSLIIKTRSKHDLQALSAKRDSWLKNNGY